MALINITRKAEVLQGLQLTTPDHMWEALKYAKTKGYRGQVNVGASGNVTLGLTSPQGNTSESANINDWAVVTNDTIISLVPNAQAGNLYQAV